MERGPLALFGAIVAIGLGPAMWLGAQFGQVTLSPERPPAVTSEQQQLQAPRGGSGAGDAPTDAEVIQTEPKSNTQPLTRTKKARPVAPGSPSSSPSASTGPSTPPVESGSPKPADPGEDESDPPTGPTTPTDDPPPGDDEPDVPPQPPSVPQSDPVADASSLV
ncbi:hypothetical protein [Actinoplanes sp. NPDC049599]|uniref:hypothetical protein n=1 Tax=Actinoplanes sp. NPDC049599 TaxID=3363903 RepID=UPI0037A15609